MHHIDILDTSRCEYARQMLYRVVCKRVSYKKHIDGICTVEYNVLNLRSIGIRINTDIIHIIIAIQNCHWNNFIDSPEQWKVILGENPDLWLKYDASHAYNRNADYLAEMSDYGEKIAHFHVKGTTHAGSRAVSDPPAGMDDLHWGSIFSILYARGYDGDLSIEPHSKTWQGELGAAGVEFTRQFISKFVLK